MEEEILELEQLPNNVVSYSQIKMFKRCHYQWFLRYRLGYKMKPRSNLVLGTGLDRGLKQGFLTKINEGGDDVKIRNIIVDVAITEIERIVASEEVDWAEYDNKDVLKDDAMRMGAKYYDEIGKKLFPEEIAKRFEIEFEGVEWKLVGEVDLVEKKLIDWKTRNRTRFDDMYFIFDEQLKLYKIIYPREVEIHGIIRQKRDVQLQVIQVNINENDIKEALENVRNVVMLMKTGIYYKKNDSQVCSWCGFRDICQKRGL
jgi:CRISPR/Cas system-associated exonuclease Cas4 (RecB family)